MKTKFSLMFLFFVLNLTLLAQDLKILSSDRNSIVIEYNPVYKDTITISSGGSSYIKVNLRGGFAENYNESGMPQIPAREFNIGVPSEFGNTIQIMSSDYSTLNGKYLPSPQIRKDSLGIVESYAEGKLYMSHKPQDIIAFGEYGLAKNLPVQTIKIYPVQFDASSNTIKLYKKIVVKISFSSLQSNRTLITDNTLQPVILNWDVARNWGVAEKISLGKNSSSILASGDWYRFETTEEGIYKITASMLQTLGIDISTLDPRTIKIYGNGGYSLQEDLSKSNNKGLIENAIYVSNQQSGTFSSSDYILFYGRPSEFWEYNDSLETIAKKNAGYYTTVVHGKYPNSSYGIVKRPDSSFIRFKNPFTKKNYYWLTYGGTTGKRMSEKSSLNVQNAYEQPTTLAFKSNDKDTTNILQSGREYFGDQFSYTSKTKSYLTTLSGIVPSSTLYYKFRLINATEADIQFQVDETGNQIYNTTISKTIPSLYVMGVEDVGVGSYTGQLSSERSNLKLSMVSGSTSASAYLDFFEITYQKYLSAVSDYLMFFSKDTTAAIQYTLSNFSSSGIQTFDVTNFSNVKIVSNATISGGQFKFQSAETSKKVSKYIAVATSAFKTPTNGTKITNTNIRGITGGYQMIVIAPKDFRTQAADYASYRSGQSPYPLSTSVFYVDEIMNEYAGGLLDPTAIRDFIKYAYENWQTKPSYVLLFGNGTYDYLNVEAANNNFVPTYQTQESLYEIDSYPSDSYYARVSGNDFKADVAIGRLPIRTADDAQNVIDKIKKYETELEKGVWRNSITLVADDGPAALGADDGSTHTAQSEALANYFLPKYFNLNKIYLVAYPTVYSGTGRFKPAVNQAIIDAMNNGTLAINWIGHGNPNVWAHETVFDKVSSIPQINNSNYFYLSAATCDFGRYDRPTAQSCTELMINMQNAGAIASFTSSRAAYSDWNGPINDSMYTNLFRSHDSNGLPVRIGSAFLQTKQYTYDPDRVNDEKFNLFGDPAIRLNEPHLSAVVDSINGKSVQSSSIQINALSSVKIKGTVRNSDGTKNSFNGQAVISVFDSERSQYFSEMTYSITLSGGLIYKGSVSVTNGDFQTEFVVPKDISYENKNGKIVAYISNDSNDGVGYTSNIIVGGTSDVTNDGKGPEISIYFNDAGVESSYLVNSNFSLIAKLTDQTGLNTTGTGIGHKLEGILNNDQANPIDFTNYFVGEQNSCGKSGTITYNFSNQEPGSYTLKIKAWDVFNNLSTQEAAFTVVSADNGIVLRDVVNYPNPFSSNTTFTFRHNVTNSINVKIKIYTVAGRMIKQIEEYGILDKFVRIDWDGRDTDGNQIANGTYIYKLLVESDDGQYKDNALGKLSVIR